MQLYRAGIDIGSTTVKLVVLDEKGSILYSDYRRHMAHTQETVCQLLREAREKLGRCQLASRVTGSGAISLGKAMDIPFVQEVVAVDTSLQKMYPQTDVAIELGGEDAKIIYITGGLEERMNGVCAGGTGSFIDQMASLLKTDASGLNELAKGYTTIYPIAARCGVFAKSDIQPMINDGVPRSDLAASIFQAVVNQTISGLACGKPIRGHVAFLGGPLHFLSELANAFIRTLHLTEETAIIPENSHLFAAIGAALDENNDGKGIQTIDQLIDTLSRGVMLTYGLKRLPPLFSSHDEYADFLKRHSAAKVVRGSLKEYEGDCFLGIDAGSTTTKIALIGSEGQLLYDYYASNQGSPIDAAKAAMCELMEKLPEKAVIRRSCSTGYGENLLKTAFSLDEGIVETIAHTTGASFFDPQVDCVLDIGGQDMKCIRLKDGSVDTILLNEACSSGCGSFLENFAVSMGYTAEGFASEALFAKEPVDLGTRCTVFMNSNVKQAQKEGASVQDISAGLSISVIKNALFKVIKLTDASSLGKHVVVQGGTFHNKAVLRAFEQLSGVEAVCPDIAGMMGAFGAALIARSHYHGQPTSTLTLSEMANMTWQCKTAHCQGCLNHCMLTIVRFPGGRSHISGNRCEKGLKSAETAKKGPNVAAYKLKRIFDYIPLEENQAERGTIGIPRVLNIYENYPLWFTMFTSLHFRVVVSPQTSRTIYELGMDSIPSESECYPAKLAHGHVQWLINSGISRIFYPSVFYEHQEDEGAGNHFNCPMVAATPENIRNNVEDVTSGKVTLLHPFVALTDEKTLADRMAEYMKETFGISEKETRAAVALGWNEMMKAKEDIRQEGAKAIGWMEENHRPGIVLASRPYHMDPEINHGIPEMIAGYNLAVLTEDCLPMEESERPLRVSDQWVYHSRLYRAAEFVSKRDDMELIQLNSFGCGLDAVTVDQVSEILENSGKLYTLLKIDEVNNLGAARIRLRSLLSAMEMRREKGISSHPSSYQYHRTVYTKEMQQQGYTLLAPRMSPIHFDMLSPIFRHYGMKLEMLTNEGSSAVDAGLKWVNNDACYPSIIVVGQMMDAVLSGKYDVDHLALLITQTGGCCRASNYVAFIRRALKKAGLERIPVISLNLNKMETNPGFKVPVGLILSGVRAVVIGDLLMRCGNRMRPYEKEKGTTDALIKSWQKRAVTGLLEKKETFADMCRRVVEDFDHIPIDESLRKPRVGIVGEILVKYMPLANNHLVELLENEGAEAVVPDLMDFFNYCMYNGYFKHEKLGRRWTSSASAFLGVTAIKQIRRSAMDALHGSKHFDTPLSIREISQLSDQFLSQGNQYGEGWFLTGEMAELLTEGVNNIVCIQPFGCLPNHVVGKGMLKALRAKYPGSNIVAVDYDPGASEVNQVNRIKLMMTEAMRQMKNQENQENQEKQEESE